MLRRLPIAWLALALWVAAQEVRVTFIGQSCFVIQTLGSGPVVVTDPPAASYGYPLPTLPADGPYPTTTAITTTPPSFAARPPWWMAAPLLGSKKSPPPA